MMTPFPNQSARFPPGARPAPFGPHIGATAVLVTGTSGLATMLPHANPGIMLTWAAWGLLLLLGTSLILESTKGFLNLARVDIVSLCALYVLTYVEFLVPKPDASDQLSAAQAYSAITLTFLAFGSIAIGRHFPSTKGTTTVAFGATQHISIKLLFRILVICFILGNLYIFLAVRFDIFRLFDEMLRSRFQQSWSRNRFGGWSTLLTEVGLVRYLIPPISALLIVRRKQLQPLQRLITITIIAFTLFQAFASGTRNLFFTYLICFVAIHVLAQVRLSKARLLVTGGLSAMILYFSTMAMVEVRDLGFIPWVKKSFTAKVDVEDWVGPDKGQEFFVDNNMISLGLLTTEFPEPNPYLKIEIPRWALVKPIPRAFWKNKPLGLSTGIESAIGVSGYTVAVTFIGEAYMCWGSSGVIAFGLFFGVMMAVWNRWFSGHHSPYALLLYVSGFVCAMITMRSLFWFTTLLLPTLFFVLIINRLERKYARTRTSPAFQPGAFAAPIPTPTQNYHANPPSQ